MNAIRIVKKIESETIHLPELKPLIGKTVEIVVAERPVESVDSDKRWQPLIDAAGKDLVDPDVYEQYREFDRQHGQPPTL